MTDPQIVFDYIVNHPGQECVQIARACGMRRASDLRSFLPRMERAGLLVWQESDRLWPFRDVNTGEFYDSVDGKEFAGLPLFEGVA